MKSLFRFFVKRPLLLFLSVYISGLILNRFGLLINPIASSFLGKTWLLIFLALTLPVISFSIATYLFRRISSKKLSDIFDRKIPLKRLAIFHTFSFLITIVVVLLSVDTSLKAGGIFILNPDSARDIFDSISSSNTSGKSLGFIPFSQTILLFSRSVPILLAIVQYFISTLRVSKKVRNLFTLITLVSLINLLISSLILGARVIVAYPLLLYAFTSSTLSSSNFKNNLFEKKQSSALRNQKLKVKNNLLKFFMLSFACLLAIGVIVQIGSLRISSTQGSNLASQITGGNPILGSIIELYLYYCFGFDVLDARIQLSNSTIENLPSECYWSTILPGYHKLAELFGASQSDAANCITDRFSIYGYTNSTYLTVLPVDNILVFVSAILLLGFVWGWSYVYHKKNIIAFILFIFINVGMFFSSFSNLIIRDFVVTGIAFLYPLLYLLLLSPRSKRKYLVEKNVTDN